MGTTPARVLSIAGSDSGGGAGIQADTKTIAALGGFATNAITAITAQNTQGVQTIHPLPTDIIKAQIQSVLSDIGTDAIKIGMLHSAEVVEVVVATIKEFAPRTPLIVDPVMVATSGDVLLQQEAVSAMTEILFPRATVITPNLPEAEHLTGYSIRSDQDMVLAAATLARFGARIVIIKGGHLPGDEIVDLCWEDGQEHWFRDARIDSPNTHGTGCTLAAALATYMAQGASVAEAFGLARQYVRGAIEHATEIGRGAHGPMRHNWLAGG